ncbi:aminopeptidase P family protein [Coprobacter tertius]|uniref:Aminopeptidase P family protein n=1 Tax=Coprobacter tertius TaxID=2944915 RepID=A0ABT1MKA2_9BACT|nr:aminopeptidase P family protein [Coprobacter tertius]MCP9613063.1 aminopeptidase P family protein [Coprobacter tertius]
MNKNIPTRVKDLRLKMADKKINAYIIPGTDPHQSEYSANHWKARGWISGFNGSAGTAVVTIDDAGLWTDSRYFLQAEIQLEGTGFKLFKQGLPGTPSIQEWLAATLPSGATVAIDGSMFPYKEYESLATYFTNKGLTLVTDFSPFDSIWKDRPEIPTDPAFVYDEKYSGESTECKISKILEKIGKDEANAILLSALDEIAWTLNIRGTDVQCNPVAICFAYISDNERVLFMDARKVSEEMSEYLKKNKIQLADYTKIYDFLSKRKGDSVFIDPSKVNYKLVSSLNSSCKKIFGTSPVAWLKSIKNETEIAGFRDAMIRDGVALVKFFRWLEANIPSGKVSEITISEKLREFRSRQALYVGESFGTIAGFNEHGAIVHYSATPESNATIYNKGFLLIDSGAQYLDGTTDITRTIALGELTEEQKRNFTLVLKGHIAIATCIYPQGTRGAQIDVLARHFLWNEGLNYLHGTGHGIGHFLNVHEGPQNIRLEENPTPLTPGMVTSDEPGVYLAGKYGIRTENLILTVHHSHNDEFGDFNAFEVLTLFPIDKRAIDKSLLNEKELQWLNDYHCKVYEKLSPGLDNEEKEWLKKATEAI